MFRWQMYAAQGMRSRWYSLLGDDFMESSDEDQDSLKVCSYMKNLSMVFELTQLLNCDVLIDNCCSCS
jgi:hypothetical protein